MLRLTATDQSITMTTSATGSVDYISDWTDIVNATAVTTAGSGQGNVTTAATTTIIAAPASGSSRAVRSAMISNRHGSTSNTIQLFKTVGAASYAISKPLVILAGETVRFSDEGFCFVGNACELEVTSATTAEQLESNATTGVMQIVGPAAGTTRVVTIPDANATMARTDAAQTFTNDQTFSHRVLVDDVTQATTTTDGSLQTDGGLSVVKNAIVGGNLLVNSATISTSDTTGAIRSAGSFTVSITNTETAGGFAYAAYFKNVAQPTANSSTRTAGFRSNAETSAATTVNFTTAVYGFLAESAHRGSGVATQVVGGLFNGVNYGIGTITTGIGLLAQHGSYGAGGTVTSSYGLRIATPSSVGTLTNAYGIYVESQNTAASLSYAIYTNLGKVFFGDDTSLAAGKYITAKYKSSDGSTGATGTFTTVDSKTVTVKDGIITSIV